MVACAIENNVAPGHDGVNDRTGATWMRVHEVGRGDFPNPESVFIPMMCMQCEQEAPCVSVCPQNAVEVDPETGIVGQIPERCLGCRYCMAACPYHARSFNWWDPKWPEGSETALNPSVSPRMRGVVEKCNFCHGRLHEAREKAAAEGREVAEADYQPACVEQCPVNAIVFGDLADPGSAVSQLAAHPTAFRFLSRLNTQPKVFYLSDRSWVRALGDREAARATKEAVHG
jgi:molybdopterin-containing oxidoreductase family iron-sulfur binding subunit